MLKGGDSPRRVFSFLKHYFLLITPPITCVALKSPPHHADPPDWEGLRPMTSRIPYRPVFVLIAFLSALLLLGGCGDDAPDVLALDVDGKTVELPLEKMDIYLVDPDAESEYPESFEIIGP